MVPKRLRAPAVAFLAILATAIAAATLTTAIDASGLAAGDATDTGLDNGDTGGAPAFSIAFDRIDRVGAGMPVIALPCVELLTEPRFFLALAITIFLGAYALYRRGGILAPIGALIVFTPPSVLVHRLLTACGTSDEVQLALAFTGNETPGETSFSFTMPGPGGGAAVGATIETTSLILLGLLGFALVVAIVLFLKSTGDDLTIPIPTATPAGAGYGRPTGVIEAHAGFDDPHEDATADNDVYRAWQTMTETLDIPTATRAPREIATAAINAGKNPHSVTELTNLFEEVRYGTADPDPDREHRARTALHHLDDPEDDE